MEDEFYKKQTWQMLTDELKAINKHLQDQDLAIKRIENSVTWIYAWAAGVGVVVSVLWAVLKDWFKQRFFA